MLEKWKRKKRWKKAFKTSDEYSSKHTLVALEQSLHDLLEIFFGYMYIPEVEKACYELIETIGNLHLMIQTDEQEEYDMLKHRVIYMLTNKLENWYI